MLKGLINIALKGLEKYSEKVVEGPFTEQRVELTTIDGNRSGKIYLQGELNKILCGKGKFDIIRFVNAYTHLDKTLYPTKVEEHEYKIGEYVGAVLHGHLSGQGTYEGSIEDWMFDQRITTPRMTSKRSIKGGFLGSAVNDTVEYYCDDKLYYKGTFKDGKIDGEGVFYLENGINLKIDMRDFEDCKKYINVNFHATFFNDEDNSKILEGEFTYDYKEPKGYKMLSGTYYFENKAYKFNEYYEVELPIGTHKLKDIFSPLIYESKVELVKYDREAQLQEWFEYFKEQALGPKWGSRRYRKSISEKKSLVEILEDEYLGAYFNTHIKYYYYSYVPLKGYDFDFFVTNYVRQKKSSQ